MKTTMDRSTNRLSDPGLPEPVTPASKRERRRAIRQKLNTPVYASFKGPQTGMVVDLSELLDLHEDGFAVQTAEALEVNRAVALCLDLPETRSFLHGSGQVIWSDAAGRAGIRFSGISDSSRRILKEWLFANLLIGCSNYAARAEQRARREEAQAPEPVPLPLPIPTRTIPDLPIPDLRIDDLPVDESPKVSPVSAVGSNSRRSGRDRRRCRRRFPVHHRARPKSHRSQWRRPGISHSDVS